MGQHVAPGVYTKIIDLSEYVRSVPSTIGFIPIISDMGPDNQLVFTNARDFFYDFGTPNINYASKLFSQGPYVCSSFLKESDSLYVVRCLPDDADFSNMVIMAEPTGGLGTDSTSDITVASQSGINSLNEIDTILQDPQASVVFYGIGRGEKYDDFRINISKHVNPQLSDPTNVGSNDIIYILDLYRRQSENGDGGEPQYEIIGSFEVSFNPNRLDNAGESMFIEDIVNRYSKYIKCKVDPDKCLEAIGNDCDFSQPFINGPINLQNGSSGSLFDSSGKVNQSIATQVLAQAYMGQLKKNFLSNTGTPLYVNEVLDTDNFYFTIILDGGYPTDVKTAIYTMVQTRKDCIALVDNGDNSSPAEALNERDTNHTYNTKYMALYECYSKVYDFYTGRDIWITPVYHMANIVPYTDNVAELWYAPAGFNRATIATIKELRFSPMIGDRDLFYLNQINPIVKFNVGYTVYSQLTTQRRPTALQDFNITNLLLYIKRALEQFTKFYVFEMNDQFTWSAISSEITKFLKIIQNKRGLYNFAVEVGANEYELKARQIHVNATLSPTRVVEQVHLNFFIK